MASKTKYSDRVKRVSKNKPQNDNKYNIVGLSLIFLALFLFIALTLFIFSGAEDQSIVESSKGILSDIPEKVASNQTGILGATISNFLFNRSFGVASYFISFILIFIGYRMMSHNFRSVGSKVLIMLGFMIWISISLGFITKNFIPLNNTYLFLGGAHGEFVNIWLYSLIGKIGTLILIIFLLLVLVYFSSRNLFFKLMKKFKEAYNKTQSIKINSKKSNLSTENEEKTIPYPKDEDKPTIADEKKAKKSIQEQVKSQNVDFKPVAFTEEDVVVEDTKNEDESILTINEKPKEETVDKLKNPSNEDYDPTLDLSNYKYPTLNILEERKSEHEVTKEEMEENNDRIVETLSHYKIDIVKIKATPGPTVTLYEIIPAPGIKISKIKNLEDDIALSLSALGIRIIAPIPGAGTIGIEVPNKNPEIVSMRGIISSKKFQDSKYALPVALGRTISNETFTFDLTKMPHLLVAGATGQGKSVGLNAIITSLLYKKHPSQLKFVMIDPKKIELSIYSEIEKHFLAKLPDEEEPIITDTSKVVTTLNSLCIEMDNRYDLLKLAQVRNIKEYNHKFVKRSLNPNKGHKYLPYIVVVIDEFADLIMTAGKEVEQPIARIAQLARAVGIHMIIATQRPSTNIITGIIKANFPARIAFKVASMIDSRTILDSPGANQLIGRGDMLISIGSEMTRVQCAFVDTPEVEELVNFIGGQVGYPSAMHLPEYIPESEAGHGEVDLGAKDSLFEDAARLIVSTQQGSTSSIQRRFSIGYNRAGRIMDQLEAAGIVGPFEGSKPRSVLVFDEYSLENLLKNL